MIKIYVTITQKTKTNTLKPSIYFSCINTPIEIYHTFRLKNTLFRVFTLSGSKKSKSLLTQYTLFYAVINLLIN